MHCHMYGTEMIDNRNNSANILHKGIYGAWGRVKGSPGEPLATFDTNAGGTLWRETLINAFQSN